MIWCVFSLRDNSTLLPRIEYNDNEAVLSLTDYLFNGVTEAVRSRNLLALFRYINYLVVKIYLPFPSEI